MKLKMYENSPLDFKCRNSHVSLSDWRVLVQPKGSLDGHDNRATKRNTPTAKEDCRAWRGYSQAHEIIKRTSRAAGKFRANRVGPRELPANTSMHQQRHPSYDAGLVTE